MRLLRELLGLAKANARWVMRRALPRLEVTKWTGSSSEGSLQALSPRCKGPTPRLSLCGNTLIRIGEERNFMYHRWWYIK